MGGAATASDPASIVRSILDARRPVAADAEAQDDLWAKLVRDVFREHAVPFEQQLAAYRTVYADRRDADGPPRAWQPSVEAARNSNLSTLMRKVGVDSYAELHRRSVADRAGFWSAALDDLGVPTKRRWDKVLDTSDKGPEHPVWLGGARMNIADACFTADADKTAIVWSAGPGAGLERISYGALERLVNRFANGLAPLGLAAGDAVAICMPMTPDCVAAYLGCVRAGLAVVSIADSFSAPEIQKRIEIGSAKAVVTVESFDRAGKQVPLYERVKEAKPPRCIVIPSAKAADVASLRRGDVRWDQFLDESDAFQSVESDPDDVTNVLFSSGTTGDPKAIPWTHLTPLKAAADGRYHQDIQAGDIVAWPTNIGWMMGPWLIYASLVNGATMALSADVPTSRGFARFVEKAKVSILGLVPSIVRAWRENGATQGCDWGGVRVFSSTGESSNAEDYLWLMGRTGYRAPVIEYCGGTEIGGGHITGTVVQPASPATFTTPALGIDIRILDEAGAPVAEGETGELFLVPPSLGLSQRLLNQDHHHVYFEGCPTGPHGEVLRRHGDEVQVLARGFWSAHGRADDTMNLGGIKVSSIELERAMNQADGVSETAAVAVAREGGGADRLVVFAVTERGIDATGLHRVLQDSIKQRINPLFRIHDVVVVKALPRTASNKVMRRTLRASYGQAPV